MTTATGPAAPARPDQVPRSGHRRPRAATGVDRAPRPGAGYVLPAALFFIAFAALPVIGVIVLSFTRWNGLGDPTFTGLENWRRLIVDDLVLSATGTTVLLTVLSWATQTPLALGLGVWAAGRQRNRAVLSAIFFLPLLLSLAAIAMIWKSILDPNFGVAGSLGPYLGFPDGNIIGNPDTVLWVVLIAVAWQYVPFHALLYQAGARNIPRVLYDAATVDGADRWKSFWHITLPQLRNTIITSSTLMIVGSLTYFEMILLLTEINGGPGGAVDVLPLLMYRTGFRNSELGFAAAVATVLVVIGTLLSILILRFSGFAKMRSTLEGL